MVEDGSRGKPGYGSDGKPTALSVVASFASATAIASAAARATGRAGGRSSSSNGAHIPVKDEVLAEKVEDITRAIGQIADRILQFVSDRMPGLEAWTISTLDTIFAPRLVLRHLIMAVVLQTGLLTWNGLVTAANKLLSRMSAVHRDAKKYRQMMRAAKDYEEWRIWAERLDVVEGHDEWRKRPDSLLYNHKVLQQQINDINAMIESEDVFALMFRLRGSLSRNQHGMLHEGLFSRAHAGTKLLVEHYHEVVCEALHYVCEKDAVAQDIPTDAKLAFFNETRHAYGRTALMLSGGAAMGVYHAGVVKALLEQRLLPRVISGASAGSIVAAMVGTRTDAELRPMFDGRSIDLSFFRPLQRSSRSHLGNKYKSEAFWQLLVPPALRWMGKRLWNVLLHSDGFLTMDTEYFRTVLRHDIGPATFQEAFDRTGRIVNITVAPRNRTDPPRLLNYLTAPHVLVWSAAVCSSSVPGVFEPSTLFVKDADGSTHPEFGLTEKFVDGSMEADLPMQQISELFNINHFIVSQVNPHASLLSTMALPKSVWSPPVYRLLVGVVGFLQAQLRNWVRNVIEFVSHRRMAPVWASKRGGIQVLTQEYEGRHCDVTITPWEGEENVWSSFARMLSNVSSSEFVNMVKVAERNTWPKVEMIRSHCAVEMALEQCVQVLRRQLTAENQVRLLALGAQSQSDGLRRRGRVPSFYTSRSIVNLSGLNVMDPSIVMNVPAGESVSAALSALSGNHRQMSFGSRHSGSSDNVVPEAQDLGLVMEEPHRGAGRDEVDSLPHTHPHTHPNDGINDHAFAGGVLGKDSAAVPSTAAEASGTVRRSTSPVLKGLMDLDWLGATEMKALGLRDKDDVVKSTTMANFYYRRSHSLGARMNRMSKQHSESTGNLSTKSDPSY